MWATWSDPVCPVKLKAESGAGVALPLLVNWKELEWTDMLQCGVIMTVAMTSLVPRPNTAKIR